MEKLRAIPRTRWEAPCGGERAGGEAGAVAPWAATGARRSVVAQRLRCTAGQSEGTGNAPKWKEIDSYHPNLREKVRRKYLENGPC